MCLEIDVFGNRCVWKSIREGTQIPTSTLIDLFRFPKVAIATLSTPNSIWSALSRISRIARRANLIRCFPRE